GYCGHNYPNRFKVWISGQVRRVTKAIRREMRRRAAIEPVIGHLKEDHRMGRNYLTGRDGDRINAVLAAASYNFSLLLRWLEELLHVPSLILWHALLAAPLHLTRCRKTFFTADSFVVLVSGVVAGILSYIGDPTAASYVVVFVFGGLLGLTEIVGRYTDSPSAALKSPGAFFYILLNAVASCVALFFLLKLVPTFENRIYQILVAGLGAMAFLSLRSLK